MATHEKRQTRYVTLYVTERTVELAIQALHYAGTDTPADGDFSATTQREFRHAEERLDEALTRAQGAMP